MWQAEGCPVIGKRPGEFDVIGHNQNGVDIERYSINAPSAGVTGDIEAMTFYAGTGLDNIREIKPASTMVEDIWKEYLSEEGLN